jgi:hypothetical protein
MLSRYGSGEALNTDPMQIKIQAPSKQSDGILRITFHYNITRDKMNAVAGI